MNKIEVKILNPDVIKESEKMMVCAARLTQRGEKINSLEDFMNLYEKEYSQKTVENMINLPHPTIQKFGVINLVVVGASQRFLRQITRHQNEVKFMSASLQYSDYSDNNNFCIPYELLGNPEGINNYISSCKESMNNYKELIKLGVNNDTAGYLSPQGLRNVLIISATPYQLKHMISQRTCKRNTTETQYVMLKIWEALYNINPILFNQTTTGPFCMKGICREGKMSCGKPINNLLTPDSILRKEFPKIYDK